MNFDTINTSVKFDLLCFSHLRWDFVYQRPQHLMSHCAAENRVFYFKEPVFDADIASLEHSVRDSGVRVVVPHLPKVAEPQLSEMLGTLLDRFLQQQNINVYCLWYYSPMAISWTRHLSPLSIVYDCMDELSAFRGAPPELTARESELLKAADLVFTGGYTLFESKRHLHDSIYPFPSSIDLKHFARSRGALTEPTDQAHLPHPRIGFAGVIDERMDLELVGSVAEVRPDWQFVMIGPVVKIDSSELPRRSNIHYLGMKRYEDLPAYLGGWDAAILPFAKNESTRFISPTKTPEYLAAGRPVVSTSIRDVVQPYGKLGLVHIADDCDSFIQAVEAAMAEDAEVRIQAVDAFLSQNSWTRTWRRMSELIEDSVSGKSLKKTAHAVVPGTLKRSASVGGSF